MIHILCGPTASGKSALALHKASECDGVIINADSMQIYDALPLLSARPDKTEMGDIPHRLYGVLPAAERCSARAWRDMAEKEITRILDRGKTPIVVGGTGLYIKALIDGLSDIPDVPPEIRERTVLMQSDLGNPDFHTALAARDPLMAARLNPNDTQRMIRAWEVLEATGKSLSYWQSMPRIGPPEDWRFHVTILRPERSALHERCDRRFDQMIERGALDEVRNAMPHLKETDPITHALGYRPLRDHLLGQIDLDTAITAAKAETRQYAKRQDTWFRHQIQPGPKLEEILIIA